MTFLYQWVDLIWVPLSLFIVHKGQRLYSVGFVLACVLTLRLQVEIMDSIEMSKGFLPLLDYDAYDRGLIVYTFFYVLYLVLAYTSPRTQSYVYMAGTISLYFMAFAVSSIVMIL